jgi:hypothetical protein
MEIQQNFEEMVKELSTVGIQEVYSSNKSKNNYVSINLGKHGVIVLLKDELYSLELCEVDLVIPCKVFKVTDYKIVFRFSAQTETELKKICAVIHDHNEKVLSKCV